MVRPIRAIQFQFLIVRLKSYIFCETQSFSRVSIPYSTIKITIKSKTVCVKTVSIPYSTIKITVRKGLCRSMHEFQFLIVRLKSVEGSSEAAAGICFNSL